MSFKFKNVLLELLNQLENPRMWSQDLSIRSAITDTVGPDYYRYCHSEMLQKLNRLS